jgi:Family of unknown function (DUF6011)
VSTWKWIRHEGTELYDIGVNADGTLHNPNGYPDGTVRAAVAAAEERRHTRRSNAARKAAETRRRRQDKHVYDVSQRIVDGEVFGPSEACVICGKGLGDPESKFRGIGSDCWQKVLTVIEAPEAS